MPAHLPRLLVTAIVAALALSGSPPPAAPAVPVGLPRLVSPDNDGDHYGPDLAADDAGGALIVWQATDSPLTGSDIFARRIRADGIPLGAPFRVNATVADEQRRPAVAALAGGGFVVAWDTNTSTVWARRFGPDGAPLDPTDLPISPDDDDSHFDPDLAALPGGGFAVAWEHESLIGVDVLLQRFSPAGLAAGPAQAPYEAGTVVTEHRSPALAADTNGALAVAWEETSPTGGGAIRLSRYDAGGAPVALAAPVALSEADDLRDPAVALGADGAASVVWARLPGRNPAVSQVEVRRHDAAGAPLTAALTVSASQTAERGGPAVAIGEWGTVVAWSDQTSVQGGARVGLAARALTPAGEPDGDELYPRLPAAGGPIRVVAVAAAPLAAWVVWCQDTITEGAEASAVYARRLADSPGDTVYLPQVSLP